MINAIKTAIYFVRGIDFLTEKNFTVALDYFEQCRALIGQKKAQLPRWYDLDIMTAECLFAEGEIELGEKKIQTARFKIAKSRKLKQNEKNYLEVFCQMLLFDYGLPSTVTENLVKELLVDGVRKSIRRRFPINKNKFRMS